jgi:hypothetical protein
MKVPAAKGAASAQQLGGGPDELDVIEGVLHDNQLHFIGRVVPGVE